MPIGTLCGPSVANSLPTKASIGQPYLGECGLEVDSLERQAFVLMAEPVDAEDLKSFGREALGVQIPLETPTTNQRIRVASISGKPYKASRYVIAVNT